MQLEDTPIYIIYEQIGLNRVNSRITIKDVGTKNTRVITVNIHDSMDSFLFILSLIRDEYKSGILFTDKSEFYG